MTKIPRDQSIKKINDAFTETRQNKDELHRVKSSAFDRCQSCIIKNDGYFETECLLILGALQEYRVPFNNLR